MKEAEFLDQLSDYKLLKNDSGPWSWKAVKPEKKSIGGTDTLV
jgi:hypothetical protein